MRGKQHGVLSHLTVQLCDILRNCSEGTFFIKDLPSFYLFFFQTRKSHPKTLREVNNVFAYTADKYLQYLEHSPYVSIFEKLKKSKHLGKFSSLKLDKHSSKVAPWVPLWCGVFNRREMVEDLCGHLGAHHLSFLSANRDRPASEHCCYFQMPGGDCTFAKSHLWRRHCATKERDMKTPQQSTKGLLFSQRLW